MQLRTFDFDRDYEAVRELWSQAGSGIQLSPSDEPEEIRHKLKRDPELFIVAEEDGRLVGTVLGGYDGRRGIVYHLAVAVDRRRQGIGKALMEALEERMRALGCYKYYLLVTRNNHAAAHFYEGLGCERMDLDVMGKVLR